MTRLFTFIVCLLVLLLSFWNIGPVFATAFGVDDVKDFPFDGGEKNKWGDNATDVGQVLKDEAIEKKDGVVQKIMKAFGIDYIEKSDGQTATFYVKEVLNRLLAILWLVALLMLLFGFYKMFFSKDHEEGFTAAKKIIMNALVAIVIIALARFLISWFFKIYEVVVTPESIEAH